ncbi:Solute carrier family 35 member C2 [Astathelohania contejeani]|uniref:Solute carrier family 35 member C2 n=1 Tax=Astathelohania contejeani TaxID=164912 RepID=A0ABQ7HXA3_9MICR|nr:Solute carrier family 35 member C2 [Thelohania contejeani]
MTRLKSLLFISFYVVLYYTTSLTLSFLTSYVLSKNEYNFRFPLFITSAQNFIHYLLARTASALLRLRTEKRKISEYLRSTLPCAVAGAIDIGISSYSLRSVSLAFYTMVKSSAPVFVLLSGFVFGIEAPSITLFLIIFLIGAGVFLTSMTGTHFNAHGFGLISMASFMAGFRWAFIQYLIQKRSMRKVGILFTIRDLCLPISVMLLALSATFEGLREIVTSEFFSTRRAITRNCGFIMLSGWLSFLLLLSEFLLVERTSVVFLSVAGIVKELIIVIYSVIRRDIQLHTINIIGLVVSIIGVLFYNLRNLRHENTTNIPVSIEKDEIEKIVTINDSGLVSKLNI